jgi:Terminase large subunit gpA, endonuclease domain
MAAESKTTLMTQAEYARHRRKSRQYISQLAKAGVLVMRGGKVDARATDLVLDDKPVEDVEAPAPSTPVQTASRSRPGADSLPQAGVSHREWTKKAGARNEALDVRCYAYAALQSLIAGRFRLNKQAQQIEALMAAKAGSDDILQRSALPTDARAERRPWVEQRDWFSRQSDY